MAPCSRAPNASSILASGTDRRNKAKHFWPSKSRSMLLYMKTLSMYVITALLKRVAHKRRYTVLQATMEYVGDRTVDYGVKTQIERTLSAQFQFGIHFQSGYGNVSRLEPVRFHSVQRSRCKSSFKPFERGRGHEAYPSRFPLISLASKCRRLETLFASLHARKSSFHIAKWNEPTSALSLIFSW